MNIYIYIGADILFMQTTSSRCAHYSPHHKLDVFPSPSKLCTSGLLICELHTAVLISRLTPRTVCTRTHAIHWMRIASKVQYNKKEINLSNITSCRDLVPLSISGTLLFTFIFFFFNFSFVFIFKSIIVPTPPKPGLISNTWVTLFKSRSCLVLKIKYANVIVRSELCHKDSMPRHFLLL